MHRGSRRKATTAAGPSSRFRKLARAVERALSRSAVKGRARYARSSVEALENRRLLATGVTINEFMASNSSGYEDPAFPGQKPDWIELYNPTNIAVSLQGWKLKDSGATPWTFPTGASIPARGFLVVAADGRNLSDPARVMHTNFSLDKDGEYLGLIRPDGSVASEFAPFPAQTADVSYGITQQSLKQTFVGPTSPLRALVPTDGSLATNWLAQGFDDSGWTPGSGGVGFDADPAPPPAPAGWNVRMVRATAGDISNIAVARQVLDGSPPAGFTVVQDSQTAVASIDYMNGGHFASNAALPNGATTGTAADSPARNQYALRATAAVTIPAGTYTIGVNSDDGFQLTIPGVTFTNRYNENYTALASAANQLTYGAGRSAPPPGGDTLGTFTLAGPLRTTITVDYFERNGDDSFEVFVSPAAKAAYDSSFKLLADGAAGWSVNTAAADPSFAGQFGLDLLGAMRNTSATAYVRIPFNVRAEDLSAFDSLLLHVKYDDGFVAWVNGNLVASANAPASPDYRSTATAANPDAQAVLFADYTIPNAAALLHEGLNVLTIQAMNVSAADSDFLNVATLEGAAAPQDVARYFSPPTPGATNTGGFVDQVADTKFDHGRGFYDAPFQLNISTPTAGAQIRYTTDGSTPSETNGLVYAGPITVSKTTTVRAIAVKPGYLPTNVDTQTYLFLDDVITQSASNSNSGTPPPGWPTSWGTNVRTDYGMDPDVVNASPYAATIKNDLKSIPSISIVTDLGNLFGPTGIYTNPGGDGIAWERRASIELINPDGSRGFQTDFGLRIRGGFSRSTDNAKHAFRVLLRPEYGANELDFPLFASQGGADKPRSFDLRTFENYAWSFQNIGGQPGFGIPDTGAGTRFIGIRDQFSRDTQYDMGWNAERGDYYHLYLNGQYWGVYNTAERPEAEYASTYFGGSPDDYDVIKANAGSFTITATDGNTTGWQQFWNLANQVRAAADAGQNTTALYQQLLGNNPDGTRNPSYPVYLDPDNLIDYMLVIFYTGNLDAPVTQWLSNAGVNNFYTVWNHTTRDRGFQFFAHDSEHSLLDATAAVSNRLGPMPGGSDFSKSNPQWIFQQLLYNADFRTRVADRIHKHFFNAGALTTQANVARFTKRMDELARAIVGESARWGDARTNGAPYTCPLWQSNINTVLTQFFPNRNAVVMNQFRTQQMGDNVAGNNFVLYPSVQAAEFVGQFGGLVAPGTVLQFTNPNAGGAGTIYYTTDGSDPRLPGGGVSPAALVYNAGSGITISGTTRVRVRVQVGGTWSAITDAVFTSSAPPAVRVTELMYHPQDAPAGSLFSADDFEYVELQNVSGQPVSLKGYALTNGVTFTFGDLVLPAGGRTVAVANLAAFRSRYGTAIPVAGTFAGHLDNGGEHLRLAGPLGETIQSFDYSDQWYPQTDGEGFSLAVRDPNQAPALWSGKLGWGASDQPGGDPGAAGSVVAPGSVVINEVAANVSSPGTTWIELRNTTAAAIDLSGWFLSNDADDLKKYRFPSGTVIPANGFLVLNEQTSYGQAANPAALTPFTLDATGGDTIVLSQADAAGTLLGYREIQDYDASDVGRTLGRVVQSDGGTDFVPQTSATPGAANAGPLVGPLVINEVMYAPVAPAGGTNFPNPNMEFVELRNVTDQSVNLFDPANPANTWRLSGGIDFVFPQNVTIPAFGYVVLTNLRPADFLALYGALLPPDALVFGPYAGFLDNAGEKLTLERPGTPVPPQTPGGPATVPYITVDKLSYGDDAPWPAAADGSGRSLARRVAQAYGNDPANWAASDQDGGTPGRDNLINTAPTVNVTAGDTATAGTPFAISGSLADPDPGQTISARVIWGDGEFDNFIPFKPDGTFAISHVYAHDGPYGVRVTVTDSQGAEGTAFFVVTVAPDTTPPAVADGQFLYQTAPRRVAIRFTEDVSPSLQPADLTVRNLTTGADLPSGATTLTWDPTTLTATWTLPPLADGNYRATLLAPGVTDSSSNRLAADFSLDFFALAGDANRDRAVNFADLLALAKNYNQSGKTWADGDFTGDGTVNFADLLILAKAYNTALPAPAPAGTASTTVAPATAASVLGADDKATPVFATTRVAKPPPAPAKQNTVVKPSPGRGHEVRHGPVRPRR